MSYSAVYSKKGLAGPSGIQEAKVSWQRNSVSPRNELTLISLLCSMCLKFWDGFQSAAAKAYGQLYFFELKV